MALTERRDSLLRKSVVLLVVAVLLSLTMVSAAFAGSGWVSNGQHGHYWSGTDGPVLLKGIDQDSHFKTRDWGHRYYRGENLYSYKDSQGKQHVYRDRDKDGTWYYYKDDSGQRHYVYLDPDREGTWKHYRDHKGQVQYYYVIK